MYLITRKLTFLVGLTLCVIVCARSQVVTSARDGLWNDPTVWDSGQVPDAATEIETVVNHNVMIPDLLTISIRNVVVNGRLTVGVGAVVDILPDAMPEKKDLQVHGTLALSDGATLNGSSVSNTSFESASRYIHLQGPLGFIPYATWDPTSTFEIAGFRSQGYINIAHSDSWKQNFGHVIYNCPQQTTAFVDLNGYLRNINGNFTVATTNNQVLRLSTTQNPVITIGGDFIIQGASKVWLSTSPTNAILNVGGDLKYLSTSTGISYLTTKGVVGINVSGEFEMNSPGRIQMASTSPDSTGARLSTLRLSGDLTVGSGVLIAPPSPGKGTIRFLAAGTQLVNTSTTGSSFTGNLDYVVEANAIVTLGNSVLSNTSGTLQVHGTLQVGSPHPLGAIQTAAAGNIQVRGTRTYHSGATIEYNGTAGQWIGNGHPAATVVNLICSNPVGVTLLNAISVGDLSVLGNLYTQQFNLTAAGNIFIAPGVTFNPRQVNLTGGNEQQISAFGATFDNMDINKSANGVSLTSSLSLRGKLVIQSSNTSLESNGHLLLLSTSDDIGGTASIGRLPAGSSITGNVTVERHMAGEGRIYRYISSPVQNGTVASLKDDFPVTGKFLDPSTGAGISSSSASLFQYDESIGGLAEGWRGYPSSGLSNANPLVVGKGYAAFIRKGTGSTVWDVTGPLNQGTIELPVSFTPNNQPSNGWNLVGNPYACAIQWDEQGSDKWTIDNISSVIAIRDNGVAGGTYKYWDMDDNYSEIPGGQIASGQAFWVRATGQNPRLVIREGVKVADGATFFRTERTAIPSFAVSLSGVGATDIAYYKVRPTAKPGLDNWDGLKLDNETFDLSIMSADNLAMAIHATSNLPCDTTIQLNIRDLTAGVYSLRLATRHDFARYTFTINDKFLGTNTFVNSDLSHQFHVTSDPASFAYDRMSLTLVENVPRIDLQVLGPTSICEYDTARLTISNAEVGIEYTAWNDDGNFLSSTRAETNGNIQITFPATSLELGDNLINIKAHATCHVEPLPRTHAIKRESTPKMLADSATACSGSAITLKASCDKDSAQFFWFDESSSTDTIGRAPQFHTPVLAKSKLYYVQALANGCSSSRHPVKAAIKSFAPAKITVIGDTILLSNYVSGNLWQFNGRPLDAAINSLLPLYSPGTYALVRDSAGCISVDNYEHKPLKVERDDVTSYAYPNPATDILTIANRQIAIKEVKILTLHGREMATTVVAKVGGQYHALNVKDLPAGNYFAVVTTLGRKELIRFIKK